MFRTRESFKIQAIRKQSYILVNILHIKSIFNKRFHVFLFQRLKLRKKMLLFKQ